MGYCPNCGAEYRAGIERCPDCDEALVPEPPVAENTPELEQLHDVYATGRRVDAELVRSMLESHGLNARLWAAGMGPWRMESALTEVTGVPNAFNSYRVMVPEKEVEDARALLEAVDVTDAGDAPVDEARTLMQLFRSRWALVGAAVFLLLLVLLFGPPDLV